MQYKNVFQTATDKRKHRRRDCGPHSPRWHRSSSRAEAAAVVGGGDHFAGADDDRLSAQDVYEALFWVAVAVTANAALWAVVLLLPGSCRWTRWSPLRPEMAGDGDGDDGRDSKRSMTTAMVAMRPM